MSGESGNEGAAWLKKKAIGVPGENGDSFIRSLRSLSWEVEGNMPVVARTAYARSEGRTRVLAAGFSAHVAKPADPRELVAVIVALARYARPRPSGV